MIARADIVKLSDEDLHWLLGAGDVSALARQVLEKGSKLAADHSPREPGSDYKNIKCLHRVFLLHYQ
jgi:sugar/nucleoside kinase (ribokinase family)